jgi:hypothetical protein
MGQALPGLRLLAAHNCAAAIKTGLELVGAPAGPRRPEPTFERAPAGTAQGGCDL